MVCQSVSALMCVWAAVAVRSLDFLVDTCCLGLLKLGDDVGLVESQHLIVIRMRQFVQREVWHSARLTLQYIDVCKFHSLRHHRVPTMLAQPAGIRMIF